MLFCPHPKASDKLIPALSSSRPCLQLGPSQCLQAPAFRPFMPLVLRGVQEPREVCHRWTLHTGLRRLSHTFVKAMWKAPSERRGFEPLPSCPFSLNGAAWAAHHTSGAHWILLCPSAFRPSTVHIAASTFAPRVGYVCYALLSVGD